ncbi:hypothetical protein FRC03_009705 [Tulasnella sp. 419]|nr:hypothetical protein FRC03_009705 [Tulasnella sp. 419]
MLNFTCTTTAPRLPLSKEDLDHLGSLADSDHHPATSSSTPLPSTSGSSIGHQLPQSIVQKNSRKSSQPAGSMGDSEDADQGIGDLVQQLSQESLGMTANSKAFPSSLLIPVKTKENSSSAYCPLQFADPLAGYSLQFKDVYHSY